MVLSFDDSGMKLRGSCGELPVQRDDEVVRKLSMLYEGECEGMGATAVASKYGCSRQWYYELLRAFAQRGTEGLKKRKTGPKTNYKRTDEVVRQAIRYRFLDPNMSPEVIAQKLVQSGYSISARSVHRIIREYGLQKKTARMLPGEHPRHN